jgi:8-oxo-dGTP diphosphatase
LLIWRCQAAFVEADESLEAAATRELAEETGRDGGALHLKQLRCYGEPDRDPCGRVISVYYLALIPNLPLAVAGGDARAAHWVPVDHVLDERQRLAFDHRTLVLDAVERVRSRLEYSAAAIAFCGDCF